MRELVVWRVKRRRQLRTLRVTFNGASITIRYLGHVAHRVAVVAGCLMRRISIKGSKGGQGYGMGGAS